jgi:hypothetical protein
MTTKMITHRTLVHHDAPAFPLGASDAAQAELVWFFRDARSAFDVPSNDPAVERRALYERRGKDSYQADDRQEERAEALHSARIVYERLRKLLADDLEVIRTLFGPEGPDWLEEECGFLAPLVCALVGDESDLAAAKIDGSLRDIVNEAHGVARRALAAYEATRAGFRRSAVPDRTEW